MQSAISLQAEIALNVLISLSELSPRVGIALNALVSLREMSKVLFLKSQRLKCEDLGYKPIVQI